MSIRLGKIRRGEPHPRIPGYVNIIICAFNSKWGALSPMRLGPFCVVENVLRIDPLHIQQNANENVLRIDPVHIQQNKELESVFPEGILPGFHSYEGKQRACVNILENFWQGSKIYEGEAVVTATGLNVLPSYFIRRANNMSDVNPHRRIPGMKGKAVLGAYYDGQIYDYISSRAFYFYYYTYLIQNIPSAVAVLTELKQMLAQGQKILLLEYDAPLESQELTLDYLRKEYLDPSHPFGHGAVLACHLLGITLEHLLYIPM